jgi:hypothetical protein
MQFLVSLSRTSPTRTACRKPAEREAESESEAVRRFYLDGVVMQIWLRDDGGACLIADGGGAQSLERTFSALPLLKSGFLQPNTAIAPKPYWGLGSRTAP